MKTNRANNGIRIRGGRWFVAIGNRFCGNDAQSFPFQIHLQGESRANFTQVVVTLLAEPESPYPVSLVFPVLLFSSLRASKRRHRSVSETGGLGLSLDMVAVDHPLTIRERTNRVTARCGAF